MAAKKVFYTADSRKFHASSSCTGLLRGGVNEVQSAASGAKALGERKACLKCTAKVAAAAA